MCLITVSVRTLSSPPRPPPTTAKGRPPQFKEGEPGCTRGGACGTYHGRGAAFVCVRACVCVWVRVLHKMTHANTQTHSHIRIYAHADKQCVVLKRTCPVLATAQLHPAASIYICSQVGGEPDGAPDLSLTLSLSLSVSLYLSPCLSPDVKLPAVQTQPFSTSSLSLAVIKVSDAHIYLCASRPVKGLNPYLLGTKKKNTQ